MKQKSNSEYTIKKYLDEIKQFEKKHGKDLIYIWDGKKHYY